MRILTVRQPYAALIVCGIKDVENRSWFTAHRGLFAVHAAATMCRSDWEEAAIELVDISGDDIAAAKSFIDDISGGILRARFGEIIGCVELADCSRAQKSPWHRNGLWGFYLRNPQIFVNPVPAKGQLGFWSMDFDLNRALGREPENFIGRALK